MRTTLTHWTMTLRSSSRRCGASVAPASKAVVNEALRRGLAAAGDTENAAHDLPNAGLPTLGRHATPSLDNVAEALASAEGGLPSIDTGRCEPARLRKHIELRRAPTRPNVAGSPPERRRARRPALALASGVPAARDQFENLPPAPRRCGCLARLSTASLRHGLDSISGRTPRRYPCSLARWAGRRQQSRAGCAPGSSLRSSTVSNSLPATATLRDSPVCAGTIRWPSEGCRLSDRGIRWLLGQHPTGGRDGRAAGRALLRLESAWSGAP